MSSGILLPVDTHLPIPLALEAYLLQTEMTVASLCSKNNGNCHLQELSLTEHADNLERQVLQQHNSSQQGPSCKNTFDEMFRASFQKCILKPSSMLLQGLHTIIPMGLHQASPLAIEAHLLVSNIKAFLPGCHFRGEDNLCIYCLGNTVFFLFRLKSLQVLSKTFCLIAVPVVSSIIAYLQFRNNVLTVVALSSVNT